MSTPPRSPGPILIINPNSSEKVTEEIARAVAPFQLPNGPVLETMRVAHGPSTIASTAHTTQAALHLADIVQSRPDASAFISACFSDPGVELCRTLVSQPVFGIQEAGILTAMARADLFGIIALGPASVARHRLRIRQMGVEARLAGELALDNASAEASGHSEAVFARTLELGATLRDRGAGALVLGCAGFSPRRAALEKELGIAVIDPVMAATAMAVSSVIS